MKRLGIAMALAAGLFIATLIISVIVLSLVNLDHREGNTRVISGDAMSPTLNDGDFVSFYRDGTPQRFQIVIYRFPNDPNREFVGRVIGLPEEEVAIRDGAVWVDGAKLDEPYLAEPPRYQVAPLAVSENEYYILGDNRNDSSDSHVWGPVPADNVVGVVVTDLGLTPATPYP